MPSGIRTLNITELEAAANKLTWTIAHLERVISNFNAGISDYKNLGQEPPEIYLTVITALQLCINACNEMGETIMKIRMEI